MTEKKYILGIKNSKPEEAIPVVLRQSGETCIHQEILGDFCNGCGHIGLYCHSQRKITEDPELLEWYEWHEAWDAEWVVEGAAGYFHDVDGYTHLTDKALLNQYFCISCTYAEYADK